MTNVAKMRFQSATNPDEAGSLVLDDAGYVWIEPSEAMLEKVADLEASAVESSGRNSAVAAAILLGLGIAVACIGWLAGRAGGRLRERLTAPRRLEKTEIVFDHENGVRLRYREGIAIASFVWAPGEYNADEAEHLFETYRRLRSCPSN